MARKADAAVCVSVCYAGVQVVNSGQTASMNCTVEGFPIESVEWLHDGLPILTAQDTRIRLPAPLVLMIEAIGRRDRGMYQCLVRSDKENAQATAELRLGGELVVTRALLLYAGRVRDYIDTGVTLKDFVIFLT